jgi:hypothetical protein
MRFALWAIAQAMNLPQNRGGMDYEE